jgi:putative flippase GtrA
MKPGSPVVRWLRFNTVGAVGIGVQLIVLRVLNGTLLLGYLPATALAVEAAVLHNFIWHERFTWADRTQSSWRASLRRFLRFNLTTGAVSLFGNLLLMEVLAAVLHMKLLVANGIAIGACSLVNFLVSDRYVFD